MTLSEAFDNFLAVLISALPTSPFAQYRNTFETLDYLPWLNWFFPVSACLAVLAAWLAAAALYLIYSVIMRWVKVIR